MRGFVCVCVCDLIESVLALWLFAVILASWKLMNAIVSEFEIILWQEQQEETLGQNKEKIEGG